MNLPSATPGEPDPAAERPRVLVTGGGGFLGRHAVAMLLRAGFDVRTLDLLPPDQMPFPTDAVDLRVGDVRSASDLRAALADCWGVVHLAGTPQLWAARRGRFESLNHRAAVQTLDLAVEAGCERIVQVSSAAIWPPEGMAFDDPSRLAHAVGPYGRSKLRAELHALALARRGAPVVVVSPTAPLGPGDDHLTPPTRMLLDFCRHARREHLPTAIAYVDVRDAAHAIVRALVLGDPGRPYLIGAGAISMADLVVALGHPRPTREVPYACALAIAYASEWWASVVTRRPPLASVEGVRGTRRPLPAHLSADLARLGVVARPLDHTLADAVAWFREVGWL